MLPVLACMEEEPSSPPAPPAAGPFPPSFQPSQAQQSRHAGTPRSCEPAHRPGERCCPSRCPRAPPLGRGHAWGHWQGGAGPRGAPQSPDQRHYRALSFRVPAVRPLAPPRPPRSPANGWLQETAESGCRGPTVSDPPPPPLPSAPCRLQATRQVTRASVEWYGPNRPQFLGPFSNPPSYLKGEGRPPRPRPRRARALRRLIPLSRRRASGSAPPPCPLPLPRSPLPRLSPPQVSSPATTAGTPRACPPTPRPSPATASWR